MTPSPTSDSSRPTAATPRRSTSTSSATAPTGRPAGITPAVRCRRASDLGTIDRVLTELIPLALVVALSPLSIIPAVLVLHTPRPRPTGLAFLAGWLVGPAPLGIAFGAVSGLFRGF